MLKEMAELFDKDIDTIGLHLKNVYESGELDEISNYREIPGSLKFLDKYI
jgi:hypothetical protein